MRYIVDLSIEIEADSADEAERNSLQLFRPGLAKERLMFILKGEPVVSDVTPKEDLEPRPRHFITNLEEGD